MRVIWTAVAMLAGGAAQASGLPSYSCVFTEPFISVDTFPGGALHATPERRTAVTDAALIGSGAADVITGTLQGAGAFTLTVTEGEGSDGMSDLTRSHVGAYSAAGLSGALTGACLRFPDGTTPRPVTGVSEGDHLNIRSGPGVRNPVIGRLPAHGVAWAHPENLVRGWARIAAQKMPDGESGAITVIEGWVNARYLGAPGGR